VTNIKLLFINSLILFSLGWIPFTQLRVKLLELSPRSLILCKTFLIINGLKTFSSKCPLLPPILTATYGINILNLLILKINNITLFPMIWAQTMVIASHYVGLTFPGIMLLPGSFSGKFNSPSPLLGPLAKNRISLATFIKLTAMVFKLPWNSTKASWEANASNLLTAVLKVCFVYFDISSAIFVSNPM